MASNDIMKVVLQRTRIKIYGRSHMSLKVTLSRYWEKIQGTLFPFLEEELGALTEKQQQLISILEVIRIEQFIIDSRGNVGRPPKTRRAIARSFIAKAVYNMPTTTMLLERLQSDISLRRICGWESKSQIPSESVFSRAFEEFSKSGLSSKVHEVLVKKTYYGLIVGHVITDASEIEAREKPAKKEESLTTVKKLGRPKKEEVRPKELSRIEKQASGQMSLEEILKELPVKCNKGCKTNSKGIKSFWVGYKLHLTVSDNYIPLAGILTSASLHDSQAAIPLAKLTGQRVENYYDLFDSGYYSDEIIKHSKSLNHVPIIEKSSKSPFEKEEKAKEKLAQKTLNLKPAEMVRYEIRTSVERIFGRLKDEFGCRFVRVKGSAKVFTHIMFGVLALTADQLLKLAT